MQQEIRTRINQWKNGLGAFWVDYRRNRAGVVGILLLGGIIILAILVPILSPYPPLKTGVGDPYVRPFSREYSFGTDDMGRDILSGVLHGARMALLVGILAAGTSTLIGILVGAISGYFGGMLDEVLMRITDLFLTLPIMLLALVIVALFGNKIQNIIIVIGILSWPGTARLLRAEFLSFKEKEFVEAARAMGIGDREIIFDEILPNAIFPAVVNASLQVATAILTEAGLSFLGAGDPNLASLGRMLNNAQRFYRQAWWMAVFPGIILFLTCLSLNLVGDGLNDYLNPRLRHR